MISTTMNSKPYMVARFASSLRRKLYRGTPNSKNFAEYCLMNFIPRTPRSRSTANRKRSACDYINSYINRAPTVVLSTDRFQPVTSFMRCAPTPNVDQSRSREDALVADPLSDETINLWDNTARRNREVFTEVFRPVPTNLVTSWAAYNVSSLPFSLNPAVNSSSHLTCLD